jgi:hypothetical protein
VVLVALVIAGAALPRTAAAAGSTALAPGAWELPEYGLRAVVDDDPDEVVVYQVTRRRCTEFERMTGADFAERWALRPGEIAAHEGGVTTARGGTIYGWNPVPGTDRLDCPSPAREVTPADVFEAMDEIFVEHYAFFKERKVDWEQLSRTYRPRAEKAANDEELFAVLRDYVAAIGDAHIVLDGAGQRFTAGKKPSDTPDPDGLVPGRAPLIAAFHAWMPNAVRSKVVKADSAAGGLIRWGVLEDAKGRVGYLYVQAMDGLASGGWHEQVQAMDDALDRAIPVFEGARGVIVDLRYNGGGEDAVALALVDRFAQAPATPYTKEVFWYGGNTGPYDVKIVPSSRPRFDGKVAVLIGPLTASAAEVAALGFRVLPKSRLFGQPTLGVFSDMLMKKLPNGWWVTLSNEIYRAADGQVYEAKGVPPHVRSPAGAPRTQDQRFGNDLKVAAAWIRN